MRDDAHVRSSLAIASLVLAVGLTAAVAAARNPEIPVTGGPVRATPLPSGESIDGWRWRAQLQKPPSVGPLPGAWWQILIEDAGGDIRWRDAATHYGADRRDHDYRLGLLEVEERWRFKTHLHYDAERGETVPGFELTRHAFAFGITAKKTRKVRITFADRRTRTVRTRRVPRRFGVPYRVYVAYHVMARRAARARHAVRRLVALNRRGRALSVFRWRGSTEYIRPARRR